MFHIFLSDMNQSYKKFHYGISLILPISVMMALFLSSCSIFECSECEKAQKQEAKKNAIYNVVLTRAVDDPYSGKRKQSFLTNVRPILIPVVGTDCSEYDSLNIQGFVNVSQLNKLDAILKICLIPCSGGQKGEELRVSTKDVLEITSIGEPQKITPRDTVIDPPEVRCDRRRDGLWVFDKVELRAMFGNRALFKKINGVFYADANGGTTYNPSALNFDRGGSDFLLGIESAWSWNAKFIDKKDHVQLGVFLGLWPVDGSLFIPLGLHIRYTDNPKPCNYSEHCGSWYYFGDAGIPLDFNTKAPIFSKRYFIDAGIGYDFNVSKSMDFSVDLGLRNMNLPLPQIVCCPDIPDDQKNPYRNSTSLFLRFGITF